VVEEQAIQVWSKGLPDRAYLGHRIYFGLLVEVQWWELVHLQQQQRQESDRWELEDWKHYVGEPSDVDAGEKVFEAHPLPVALEFVARETEILSGEWSTHCCVDKTSCFKARLECGCVCGVNEVRDRPDCTAPIAGARRRGWNYSTIWYKVLRGNVMEKEIRGSACISVVYLDLRAGFAGGGTQRLNCRRRSPPLRVLFLLSIADLVFDYSPRCVQLTVSAWRSKLVLRCGEIEMGMAGRYGGRSEQRWGRKMDSKVQYYGWDGSIEV